MKKNVVALSAAFFALAVYPSLFAVDLTDHIPQVDQCVLNDYEKIADVAQHKNADWNNVVYIAHDVSLSEASDIAASNPAITYFFRVKGDSMCLETEDGSQRSFSLGDAVFFTGEPSWDTAPDLADGYVKR